MKTYILPAVLLALILVSCSSSTTRNTIVRSVSTFDLEVTPASITHRLSNGLDITIEMVDPMTFDDQSSYASYYPGRFHWSSSNTQVYSRRNETETGPSPEAQKKLQNDLAIIKFLEKKVEEGAIPAKAGEALAGGVMNPENVLSKSEISAENSVDHSPNTFNPFYSNGSYLSTFNIYFTNPTSNVITFSQDDLQIQESQTELPILDEEYFVRNQRSTNSFSMEFLKRVLLNDSLLVLPGNTIKKTIAIPPVSPGAELIEVSLIEQDGILEFDFSQKLHVSQKKITYKEYQVFALNYQFRDDNSLFVLLIEGTSPTLFKGRSVYLTPEVENKRASIYGFTRNASGLSCYQKIDFPISEFSEKRSIYLDIGDKMGYSDY